MLAIRQPLMSQMIRAPSSRGQPQYMTANVMAVPQRMSGQHHMQSSEECHYSHPRAVTSISLQYREESGREPGRVGHTSLPLEAMTLASAVALELYSPLMRPSTMGTLTARPRGSGEGSGPPHAVAGCEERISDQEANRSRWSEEDEKLLLSMRHQNKTWEVIQQRFLNKTLWSLWQRYSILNSRSTLISS
ncbi:hypothetical protein BDBG_17522 [Blastomyces gilchristii SLH14081]|uniref:Myb-like domain-containing protein n=1 Tax=Blastomyces gilchristii (strain SLH14081) TaxID=559298 RepID=A0A179UWE3_BLAGS|nr:uncharacterized protein BDBG_17522 [Blastomyces gilchristii SLH14081]OAT11438.1 hypothetical protein BDBG_17522 [Blastomyces gilchristii SLH14081]